MATVNTFNIGDITLPGDGYPPLAAFSIPVTSGLISALFFGAGSSLITDDFAPGAAPADIAGSPISASGYTAMSGSSYIESAAVESLAMTLFIIARKTDYAQASGFIGNLLQGVDGGIGVYSSASVDSITGNASRVGVTTGITATAPATPTAWGMYSFVVPASGSARLTNLTTGSGASTAATEDRLSKGERLLVGAMPYTTIQGPTQMALALIFNRAISDVERDTLKTWARDYAAGYGISV